MATSELHTRGLVPAVNDLAACVAIVGAYIVRFGVVAEGVESVWWHLPLIVTTDAILPACGAVWLLVLPALSLYRRMDS